MKKISFGFCFAIFLQNYCLATGAEEDIEELKKCPCVQKYVLEVYGENLAETQPKKKKKKKIIPSAPLPDNKQESDNDEQDEDDDENEEEGNQQAAEKDEE